jgi:hypothetical protein
MRTYRSVRGALGACVMVLSVHATPSQAPSAAAEPFAPLDAARTDAVARGRRVMQQRKVPDAPWPRLRFYQFIDATPEQVAAVLFDYEAQTSYVPSVKYAKVLRRPDPATAEVMYRYHIPIVRDDEYTVRDRLRRVGADGYAIDWTLASGQSASHVEGSARVERWRNPVTGREGTLLVYDQFVVPRAWLARLWFIRDQAIEEQWKAVESITTRVRHEIERDPALLKKQIAELRAALGER